MLLAGVNLGRFQNGKIFFAGLEGKGKFVGAGAKIVGETIQLNAKLIRSKKGWLLLYKQSRAIGICCHVIKFLVPTYLIDSIIIVCMKSSSHEKFFGTPFYLWCPSNDRKILDILLSDGPIRLISWFPQFHTRVLEATLLGMFHNRLCLGTIDRFSE